MKWERVRHNSAGTVSTTASADGVSKASSRTPSRIPCRSDDEGLRRIPVHDLAMAAAFAGGVRGVKYSRTPSKGRRTTSGHTRHTNRVGENGQITTMAM